MCFLLALLLAAAALAEKRPFSVDDLIKFHRLDDPVLSPDGDAFAYTETVYLDGSDDSVVELYLSSISNPTERTAVCSDACGAKGNPTWTSDGSILLFTCPDDDGVNNIFATDLSLASCVQVSFSPIDVDNVHWSPSNDALTFTAEVYFGMSLDETAAENQRVSELPYEAVLFSDPYIRHWDTWITPGKWIHLHAATVSLSSGMPEIGEIWDVMADIDGDCPLRPFGDRSQIAISPDGVRVAFITQTGEGRPWKTDDDLYVAYLTSAEAPLTCITCEYYPYSSARASTPVWSNDGSTLYFLGMKEPESESDRVRLMATDAYGSFFDELSEGFDRNIDAVTPDPTDDAGCRLYIEVGDMARERLFLFDTCTGAITRLTDEGSVSGVSIVAAGENMGGFLFSRSSYTRPSDIYYGVLPNGVDDPSELDITRLTTVNDALLDEVTIVTPGEFTINDSGDDVQSWYFLPPDYEEGAQYPLILYVHGGPEDPWSTSWSYRWNPQTICSQGYAMVLTNFHGSSTFGEDFEKSIRLDWFGQPFQDVIDGMNWMIAQGFVDPDRIGAMGASYGGTFMNWLNGHNDYGVKAIVCHDGIFDLRAFGLDTEELYFPEREMGGPVYDLDARENYETWNPTNFVKNWETPMLVIHGGKDFRISENHGIGAFHALRRRGVDSQLLYFPTMSHWVYSPQESVVWHENVLGWFAEYLQ